jgi:hypothetical protein
MTTHRVVLDYACYAVHVEDGVIKEAAPIAKWATGKTLEWFTGWVEKKGGYVHELGVQCDKET